MQIVCKSFATAPLVEIIVMNAFSLRMLGPLQLKRLGETITNFRSQRAIALLVYLVCEERPIPRAELVELFWPDKTAQQGRANLRWVLNYLGKLLPNCWEIDRQTAVFQASSGVVDIYQLRQALDQGDMAALATAVATIQGSFMRGFYLDASPEFETWLLTEREKWQRQIQTAFKRLITFYKRQGEVALALSLAQQWLALDPWQEEAHRLIMELQARQGQFNEALAQYETCRRILAEELGVEPTAVTLNLHQRLKQLQKVRHNLPPQATPFVGRTAELDQIRQRLADPEARLVTLVGPGGMGKTRLALQVGEFALPSFLDGVVYLPLTAVTTAELLPMTLVDALQAAGFITAPSGQHDPGDYLLAQLHDRELLLILDSFEHLLKGVPLLLRLLERAKAVKLLVTSRQRLNVRWEYPVHIAGLPYPDEAGAESWEQFTAVQLFVQAAQQAQPDFAVTALNRAAISQICRQLNGMPLGLELAAAWVRLQTCAAIAAEIDRNLDFLTATYQDVPERQRSIRAIFDVSWAALTPQLQAVLASLAVFRHSFDLTAAENVAGATAVSLTTLLDKSLVHRTHTTTENARYVLHDLLRQYLAEKLAQDPDGMTDTYRQHAHFFGLYLQQQEMNLAGADPVAGQEAIANEIDNIRAAWQWLVEQKQVESVADCLHTLYLFYNLRGWSKEGVTQFELAIEQLGPDDELTYGRLLSRQARFHGHLGNFEQAQKQFEQSLTVFRSLAVPIETAFALCYLGEVEGKMGAYQLAQKALEESLNLYQTLQYQEGIARTLNKLGSVLHNQGLYKEAQHYYEESQLVSITIADRRAEANSLHSLGFIAYEMGAFDEAKQRYRESLAIKKELDDLWGAASSLNNLGIVHYDEGNHDEAETCYRESLAIRRQLGDRWGVASALNNLALVASARGDYAQAKQQYRASLALCRAIGDPRGAAIALNNLGYVAYESGDFDEAIRYHQESLNVFNNIGHVRGITFAHGFLGNVYLAQANYDQAKQHYYQLLQLAQETKATPRTLDGLVGLAAVSLHEQNAEITARLVAIVLNHPSSEKQTREKAHLLSQQLATQLMEAALTKSQPSELKQLLDDVVETLLATQ